MLKPYVITMDRKYVRNSEYMQTGDMLNREFKNADPASDSESHRWKSMPHGPLIDIIAAEDEHDAVEKASLKTNIDGRVLAAYAAPAPHISKAVIMCDIHLLPNCMPLHINTSISGLVLADTPEHAYERLRRDLPELMEKRGYRIKIHHITLMTQSSDFDMFGPRTYSFILNDDI